MISMNWSPSFGIKPSSAIHAEFAALLPPRQSINPWVMQAAHITFAGIAAKNANALP
jgi:hypothetical protein